MLHLAALVMEADVPHLRAAAADEWREFYNDPVAAITDLP